MLRYVRHEIRHLERDPSVYRFTVLFQDAHGVESIRNYEQTREALKNGWIILESRSHVVRAMIEYENKLPPAPRPCLQRLFCSSRGH
jgi:hypothetical protein